MEITSTDLKMRNICWRKPLLCCDKSQSPSTRENSEGTTRFLCHCVCASTRVWIDREIERVPWSHRSHIDKKHCRCTIVVIESDEYRNYIDYFIQFSKTEGSHNILKSEFSLHTFNLNADELWMIDNKDSLTGEILRSKFSLCTAEIPNKFLQGRVCYEVH